ncbi:MAG: hypothetical protein BJ554DRAFT_2828 [Olpidium bornovanus]|uniref:DUF4200 domain-containing protein n=1 Tax=Olpidium bornovanus TaxID=278681 RepID=A0A8H7ZPT4_9FUNG|nr:MAG: hypothetical protein BJ554DRAFT_2828 [Olpidium bornovanus]
MLNPFVGGFFLRCEDRHFGKENLHDFIQKKREMFLVQYALGVKRDETKKLEEIAQAEEQKFLDNEKKLEEDAAKFDAFLKENDKSSVDAIRKAEMETKAKLEKVQEIKKLNLQITAIRSDMSKDEDQLKDLQRYRDFLDKLTPPEWFAEQALLREQRRTIQAAKAENNRSSGADQFAPGGGRGAKSSQLRAGASRKAAKGKGGQLDTQKRAPHDRSGDGGGCGAGSDRPDGGGGGCGSDTELDEPEGPPMYFTRPQQLLDIFAELEENNLALIQNSQETEETLDELRQKIAETKTKMEKETTSLRAQIEFLNAAIAKEEQKAKMLEERAE